VNSGIAVAWIKADTSKLSLSELDSFNSIEQFDGKVDDDQLIRFLGAAIQETVQLTPKIEEQNLALVVSLLNEEIVVQSSPVDAIPLGKLLGGATAASIGTGVGVLAAGGNPLLMIVTIPAGIIIIGSAIGISKGLENGLRVAVERWIKKT
jgi:hypothetical protein